MKKMEVSQNDILISVKKLDKYLLIKSKKVEIIIISNILPEIWDETNSEKRKQENRKPENI